MDGRDEQLGGRGRVEGIVAEQWVLGSFVAASRHVCCLCVSASLIDLGLEEKRVTLLNLVLVCGITGEPL